MDLKNLSIGNKLTVGIVISTALLTLMIWIGVSRMGEIKSHLDSATEDRLPKIALAKNIKNNILVRAVVIRNIVLTNDDAEKKKGADLLKETQAAYANLEKKLGETIHTPESKVEFAHLQAAVAALKEPTEKIIDLGLSYKADEAINVLQSVLSPLENKAAEFAEALAVTQVKHGAIAQQQANAAYRSALALLIVIGIAAIGLLAVFGWLLTRSITRPLNKAVDIARAVAAGDLSLQFAAGGKSETGQLLMSLKDMQVSLTKVVSNVRNNAESVAAASAQIAQGNNDLSGRTEGQAGALEETAAAMEQLSSTVQQNAENARQATQLAQSASTIAVKGGNVVSDVVTTMQDINDSSRKITEIISVIDSIAFQTNILALNAAVEAARAGEGGRGFAVVASEVRSLAQRSAQAAKEIKTLISASVERVRQGTQQVDQAGVTMQEIVVSIKRLTGIMSDISAASTEQATGVSQVSEAVMQMDQTTQENATLVEESSAAAESLQIQAQQLVQAVALFKLNETPSSSTTLLTLSVTGGDFDQYQRLIS